MATSVKLLREGVYRRRYTSGVPDTGDLGRSTIFDGAKDVYEVSGFVVGNNRIVIAGEVEQELIDRGWDKEKYGVPLREIEVPRKHAGNRTRVTVTYGNIGFGGGARMPIQYSTTSASQFNIVVPVYDNISLDPNRAEYVARENPPLFPRARIEIWLHTRIEEDKVPAVRNAVAERMQQVWVYAGVPYVLFDMEFKRLVSNEVRGAIGMYTHAPIVELYDGTENGFNPYQADLAIPKLGYLSDWVEKTEAGEGGVTKVIAATNPLEMYEQMDDVLFRAGSANTWDWNS